MVLHVEDIMIRDVITINSDYPVKYAESLMMYFGVKCLIVLRDKEPVGIITIGDIDRRVLKASLDPLLVKVEEVMSEPLIWVSNRTSARKALKMMLNKDIKRLPVIGQLSRGPTLLGMLDRSELEGKYPKLFRPLPTH